LEGALVKRVKPEILAQFDDTGRLFVICRDALSILADIVTTPEKHRPPDSTLVYVGHFVHKRVRITGRILGPLRVDGGLLLVTRQSERHGTQHQICLLEDLLQDSCDNFEHIEFASKLQALTEKALGVRQRIGSEATNYFSGGKVVKSLL
jgi:hypothetical protein